MSQFFMTLVVSKHSNPGASLSSQWNLAKVETLIAEYKAKPRGQNIHRLQIPVHNIRRVQIPHCICLHGMRVTGTFVQHTTGSVDVLLVKRWDAISSGCVAWLVWCPSYKSALRIWYAKNCTWSSPQIGGIPHQQGRIPKCKLPLQVHIFLYNKSGTGGSMACRNWWRYGGLHRTTPSPDRPWGLPLLGLQYS